MGTRGPMPKRAVERRRRNLSGDVDTVQVFGKVRWPKADAAWHEIAQRWYRSLQRSGQSVYYEPSDVEAARLVAFEMSRMVKRRSQSAEMFASVWKAMTDLLTTEAARRRARIEIDRVIGKPDAEPKVSVLDDYRGIDSASSDDIADDDEDLNDDD